MSGLLTALSSVLEGSESEAVVVSWAMIPTGGTPDDLITPSYLQASTYGVYPGSWAYHSGVTELDHTFIATETVTLRHPITCNGQTFQSVTRAIKFDRDAATPGVIDDLDFTPEATYSSFSMLFVMRPSLVGSVTDRRLDWHIAIASEFGVAPQQFIGGGEWVVDPTAQGSFLPHTNAGAGGGYGGPVAAPASGGIAEIHCFYDGVNNLLTMARMDATTGVLIGAGEVFAPFSGSFSLHQIHDYPGNMDGGSANIIAFAIDYDDNTFPLFPFTFPSPTVGTLAQTEIDTLVFSLTRLSSRVRIERTDDDGASWDVLEAAYSDVSYEDTTVSDGETYRYRVTALLGTHESASVETNDVEVDNAPFAAATNWLTTVNSTAAELGINGYGSKFTWGATPKNVVRLGYYHLAEGAGLNGSPVEVAIYDDAATTKLASVTIDPSGEPEGWLDEDLASPWTPTANTTYRLVILDPLSLTNGFLICNVTVTAIATADDATSMGTDVGFGANRMAGPVRFHYVP